LNVAAKPGERVTLKGLVTDPDRNDVTVRWWQFRTGTYPGEVVIEDPESAKVSMLVPTDAKPGETIHVILEATDNGSPQLTRYQRVIVTVGGK
jgi:hypothetical protein